MLYNDVPVELGIPEQLCLHQCHGEQGWRITMVNTGETTLKGGRIKQVERYVTEDTFLVTYGDGVADVDLHALIRFHCSHGRIATITGINPASRFGKLKVEDERVTAFHEKPKELDDDVVNGGFFVFNRAIFDYLTEACDLEYGPLETLAEAGELMVYRHAGFWACMDTLRDMEYLNRLWIEGKAEWKIW